jgi:predicted dehydrogenase
VTQLGVIGTGPIAPYHLDAIEALPDVTVRAIAGRRTEPRNGLAARYGIDATFSDYRDLLRCDGLDGVLVLVAPDAMAAVAKDVLQTRVPTFLEKPPGLSYPEAADLADSACRLGTLNMVGLNRRFYSTVAAAIEAVTCSGPLRGLRVEAPEDLARARAAGRDNHILARWVYANSVHTIDLLRYLGGSFRTRHVSRASGRPPEEISIVATFELESGAVAEYVSHWGSPGPWNVTLYGRELTAVLSPLEEGWTIDRARVRAPLAIDDADRSFKPGFLRQMEAFVASIRSGVPVKRPAADLADAAQSMSLAAWMVGDTQ